MSSTSDERKAVECDDPDKKEETKEDEELDNLLDGIIILVRTEV